MPADETPPNGPNQDPDPPRRPGQSKSNQLMTKRVIVQGLLVAGLLIGLRFCSDDE